MASRSCVPDKRRPRCRCCSGRGSSRRGSLWRISIMESRCTKWDATRAPRRCLDVQPILAPADPAPWTNLSAALVALGHAPAARAAARRAIRAAPDLAEAHYALGAAELAADDPQAAQESFLRAIQRRRDMPQAWINLVLILARQGQAGLAQQAIAQGLAACPGNGALRAAQASFALLSGEHDAAIATLRDVLVQDPGCVAARLTLAEAVLLDEGPREALALLDGAAPAGREGAHWRAHRALALLQLNEDAAAQLELGAVAPPYGDAAILISWARCNLALHAGRMDEAAQEAAHMDTLAADEAGMLYEHRVIAHYNLARYHHRAGRTRSAFDHWAAGHRLLARLQPFSRSGHAAFIDASIALYDRARLHAGPVAAQRRSGSGLRRRAAAIRHNTDRADPCRAYQRARCGRACRAATSHAALRAAVVGRGDDAHDRARTRRRSTKSPKRT